MARVAALPFAGDPFELAAYVLKILWADAHAEHFLNHGKEIGQRANRNQRWGIRGTHQATRRPSTNAFSITLTETPR